MERSPQAHCWGVGECWSSRENSEWEPPKMMKIRWTWRKNIYQSTNSWVPAVFLQGIVWHYWFRRDFEKSPMKWESCSWALDGMIAYLMAFDWKILKGWCRYVGDLQIPSSWISSFALFGSSDLHFQRWRPGIQPTNHCFLKWNDQLRRWSTSLHFLHLHDWRGK